MSGALEDRRGERSPAGDESLEREIGDVERASAAVERQGTAPAVTGTVDSVRGAVRDTVDTVKETFDIRRYFREYPWAAFGAVEVHYFLEYWEYRPVPLLSTLIDWLFEFTPDWIALGYLILVSGYALGGAVWDSCTEAGS